MYQIHLEFLVNTPVMLTCLSIQENRQQRFFHFIDILMYNFSEIRYLVNSTDVLVYAQILNRHFVLLQTRRCSFSCSASLVLQFSDSTGTHSVGQRLKVCALNGSEFFGA